ncbi:MAG: hypothetical protein KDE27_10075 [Planctomycetes bacterium]|nr:hypothetical protein [Planctomycetota bacterium]
MSLTGKLLCGFLFAGLLQVAQMLTSGYFVAQMQQASLQVSSALSASLSVDRALDGSRQLQTRIREDLAPTSAPIRPQLYRVYVEEITRRIADLAAALAESPEVASDAVEHDLVAVATEFARVANQPTNTEAARDAASFLADAIADLEQSLLRTQIEVSRVAAVGVDSEREVHELPVRASLVITLLGLLVMATFVSWFSRQLVLPVQRAQAELEDRVRERTAALGSTVEQLEAEIVERRRAESQKEQLTQQLLETSRRAGMAELANGVLHNVGNVLNSLATSTSRLQELLGQSRAGGLQRALALVPTEPSALTEFLTTSEQGARLRTYLGQLGEQLLRERTQLQAEVRQIGARVGHMAEIVNCQQTYARVAGTLAASRPSTIVEDVVAMHATSLAQRDIRVETTIGFDDECMLDRSRIMQILMNLVANSKHAMTGGGGILRLSVTAPSPATLAFEVTDNGAGIAAENLTRIFAHGFTTKVDGHGFGLHHSANAATEMGGRLRVESPGVGLGATFVLEIPRQVATAGGRPQMQCNEPAGAVT